eukprot:GFUD01008429.1.p1 GENE.GFUD01008429.1~~GFUD01008429.1.p1  ORF type:complete len:758 (+),score=132.02 GFUD01008429.1:578-2851(+)
MLGEDQFSGPVEDLENTVNEDGTLTQAQVLTYESQPAHNGKQLTCIVNHRGYSEDQLSAQQNKVTLDLDVQFQPVAADKPQEFYNLAIGKEHVILMSFRAHPKPSEVHWALSDGIEVAEGSESMDTRFKADILAEGPSDGMYTARLTMNPVKPEDAGTTSELIVTNELGTTKYPFTLSVGDKPAAETENETDKNCGDDEICLKREDCPSFLEEFDRYTSLTQGFEKSSLRRELRDVVCNKGKKAVCCPNSESVFSTTQTPSILNPPDQSPSVRLSAVVATCGILPLPDFTHAVSGEGEINAPWAVSIGEYVEEDWIHSCTGSMITSSIILTAAHCITSVYYNQSSTRIKAGLNNPQNSRGGQESKIRKAVVHDNWLQEGERILYYDIALMFIEDRFILGTKIALLCLPIATKPPTNSLPPSMIGANIITVGWGRDDDDVIGAEITSIEYAIRSHMECNSKYNTTSGRERKRLLRQLPRLIEDTQFCGENSLSDDIGTCNGDSGGPTFVRNWISNRERFTIVGVTSGSPGCGGKLPDFYTFVAHEEILSWIHKSVAEDEVGSSIFNHLSDGRSVVCQEDTDCASDDCIEGICNPLYTRASRLGPSRRCNSEGSNRLCYDGTSCVPPRCNQFMDSCWCPARKRNRRVAMETDVTEVGNSTSFTFVDGAPEDWEIECSTDKDCPSEWFCEDDFCFAPYTFPSAAWKSLSAPISGGISTIQISDTNTPTPPWRCPNGGWLHCNSNNRCWCNKRWNRSRGGK